MPRDGLDLAIGATCFQKVDGCVLAKAVKRVVFVDTIQTKASPLWLPIFLKAALLRGWPAVRLGRPSDRSNSAAMIVSPPWCNSELPWHRLRGRQGRWCKSDQDILPWPRKISTRSSALNTPRIGTEWLSIRFLMSWIERPRRNFEDKGRQPRPASKTRKVTSSIS